MSDEFSSEAVESPTIRIAASIAEVVTSGLCVGCGLCESVTGGRVIMTMTSRGALRPTPADRFTAHEERVLMSACPGVTVEPRQQPGVPVDPIWGAFSTMRYAWSDDPDLRFLASTGGLLTALGLQLLESNDAAFVLHVGPEPTQPMRSRWVISETRDQLIANAGSRYGPTAPLAGLGTALDRRERFAIIAKPCDLNAVHRYSLSEPRLDELCVARLAMVCGGQSLLTKSQAVLDEFGISENEVTLFRYRGHGNPGPTRVETSDGRTFEKTYLEMWADPDAEIGWELQTRCKLCPDPLGEAADIAAADIWPGGAPVGDDDGFNCAVVRSPVGEELMAAAVAAGHVVLGDLVTPGELDDAQPHQQRKKEALAARFLGLAAAGLPVIATPGLRLDELGERLSDQERDAERTGTIRRVREGRVIEPLP